MTGNVIYCFSGSGNSLYIAKKMAEATGAEIKMIRKALLTEDIYKDYNCIGIIFPVYHQSLPVMVMDFVKKLRGVKCNYFYAISTYGDRPTLALEYLEKLLRQEKVVLNRGFAIQMPYNYLRPGKIGKGLYDAFRITIPEEEVCREQYHQAERKMEVIKMEVLQKVPGEVETSDRLIEHLVDILNIRDTVQKRQWLKVAGYMGVLPKTFRQGIRLMDCKFMVTEECISCRLCESVCPADNISFMDGKPEWHHQCEQCMACLHWCPAGAINYGVKEEGPRQYQHPQITFSDIIG